jgi:hypothetical protein
MTKARILADFISDGSSLADGTISVAEVSGAAPLASPTFTGTATVSGNLSVNSTALVTGVLTTTAATVHTGGITMPDNAKAIFGAGSDLEIYHDGSNSHIQDNGTGNLVINGTEVRILSDDTSEYSGRFITDGAVELSFNGDKKFETTNTGIDVTGTAVTDGLTVAGNLSVDGGTIKLDGNYPVGSDNVALGDGAFDAVTSGIQNTAIGANSMTANTSGTNNSAVGRGSLATNISGSELTAVGSNAMFYNTGSYNTALGSSALFLNTSGGANTAVGYQALYDNVDGFSLVGVGNTALQNNTTGYDNVAVGVSSLNLNTSGINNTAMGNYALPSTITTSNNTGLGYRAGYLSTGSYNTFVGNDSGYSMTTGTKNTILGRYDGNTGGLDIRTLSNNIVLSDGDGNPRIHIDSSGNLLKLGSGQIRSTGTNGLSVFAANIITVANGATITLSAGSSAQLICIACGSTGTGGTFFANYNTLVSQLGGSASGVSITDAGAVDIAVYKTINDNTVTFKNRSGAGRVYHISIFCASNGGLS